MNSLFQVVFGHRIFPNLVSRKIGLYGLLQLENEGVRAESGLDLMLNHHKKQQRSGFDDTQGGAIRS